ncbi:MAG: hypothetical protein ABW061_10495 [Polyangiaceae bacterium]
MTESARAPRPSWLLIGMIIASTAGLIATEDVKEPQFRFATSISGAQAQLTSEAPSKRFLVHVNVNALGPEGSDTSHSAIVSLHGKITTSDADSPGSPFVEVQLGGASALSSITEFNTSQSLAFTGDCAQPSATASPCEAHFEVALTRADAGARSGVVLVDWNLDFSSSANKRGGYSEGPSAPPWSIDVSPQ